MGIKNERLSVTIYMLLKARYGNHVYMISSKKFKNDKESTRELMIALEDCFHSLCNVDTLALKVL